MKHQLKAYENTQLAINKNRLRRKQQKMAIIEQQLQEISKSVPRKVLKHIVINGKQYKHKLLDDLNINIHVFNRDIKRALELNIFTVTLCNKNAKHKIISINDEFKHVVRFIKKHGGFKDETRKTYWVGFGWCKGIFIYS